MIKTLMILFILLLSSCSGVLYTGISESSQAEQEQVEEEKDTITITITFFENDPLWEAYLIWLEAQELNKGEK